MSLACSHPPRLVTVSSTRCLYGASRGYAAFADLLEEGLACLPFPFHLYPARISTPRCAKTASFPPPESSAPRPTSRASRSTKPSTSSPSKIPKPSGPASPKSCTGSSPGTKFWNGISPGPSGSSAAKLNLSYNCVDRHALGARADKTAIHLGRRAGRNPPPHLRRTARRSAEVRQRPQGPRHQERATASPSTWA